MRSGHGLEEAIEGYLTFRRNLGFACEKTLRWMLRQLLAVVKARLGREPVATDIGREDLDAVLLEGRRRGYSPTTLFHTATILGLFCRWLHGRGVLLLDPSRGFVVKRPPRPLLFVPSREEVKLLLELAKPQHALLREGLASDGSNGDPSQRQRVVAEALRDRAALELLYGSGLRYSEMTRLDVSDVDLSRRTLFVRCGKGRKDRVVPMTKSSAMAISRYLSQGRDALASQRTSKAPWTARARKGALFLSVSGSRLRDAWRESFFKPLAERAGLPSGCGPHRLRHACALHLLESGASIVAIARLLGHASLRATTIYLRLSTASLAKAILSAHPRERSRSFEVR